MVPHTSDLCYISLSKDTIECGFLSLHRAGNHWSLKHYHWFMNWCLYTEIKKRPRSQTTPDEQV